MDVRQLEQCIQEYGKDIYAFCSQLTRNRQEAEELYQDTFLKAMELVKQIDSKKNPKSYLASIALRIWKNQRRKYAWRSRIAGTEELKGELGAGAGGQGGSSGARGPLPYPGLPLLYPAAIHQPDWENLKASPRYGKKQAPQSQAAAETGIGGCIQ